MKTIAVVTTSRADYSHLYWVLKEIEAHRRLSLKLIAIGAHLAQEFGTAAEQITADGFRIDERVECLLSSDTDVGMAKTIGIATLGLAEVLDRMRPDLLLLIADRYELLAPASVTLALRIPIAHIEGGEVSEGAIDEAVRNALTKLAHIHFPPTETAARRVLALGEEPWRVHRVGAPSLDHLRRRELLPASRLAAELGLDPDDRPIVVAFHPLTLAKNTLSEAGPFFEALERIPRPLHFCFPNADAGSRELIRLAWSLCGRRSNAALSVNLNPIVYWSLLGNAAAMLGNSSSGIMETPSLELPCVNVGIRQRGRERARNIIDVPAEADAIVAGVERALDPSYRATLRGMTNPYGDGRAAGRIVEVLDSAPGAEALLFKPGVRV